jgi:hypothetical protein
MVVFGIPVASRSLSVFIYRCGHCGTHADHDVTSERRQVIVLSVPIVDVGLTVIHDTCTTCGHELALSTPAEDALRVGWGRSRSR